MSNNKTSIISVRVDINDCKKWKAYAYATGLSLNALITQVVNDYISVTQLTKQEQDAYELQLSRLNNETNT